MGLKNSEKILFQILKAIHVLMYSIRIKKCFFYFVPFRFNLKCYLFLLLHSIKIFCILFIFPQNSINIFFLGDKLKEYEEIYNQYNKIVNESKLLGVDLSQTIFGNINTNNRQVLEWTDENLATYKDAIESWGSTVEQHRLHF